MLRSQYSFISLLTLFFCFLAFNAFGEETYQNQKDFLHDVFKGVKPQTKVLWITKALRPGINQILGHELPVLRLRYWQKESRTVWILEEIGKEEPITVGVVINKGKIENLKVLIYRESRGKEVRYPFFTSQFKGLYLDSNKDLSSSIDGITGATLSVRALKKIAALALYLERTVTGNYEKQE